ncbi:MULTISPECIES: ASCH domain-containing protein [Nostoc]|uniref:ASCH domain-containing protein n=1 Tax=Nostoc paludosum FACHB-159 TaxID=2692908 RepID=A0ABR8KPN4_9NOSO|nr:MULTISPECIES: ASCH domain-containing protein [Nostoc]MBD2683330.1 ASCH domain-containing protein [Nostoc sp. FACHB-857]MBD2739647.1 ASCH domain-containing protein [Nostoc paludosum FACHB-159]
MSTTIIKAISLHQPWASLIPMGLKKYETRSWSTSYRGPLLICAAKKTSTPQKLTHNYLFEKYQQILVDTDNYIEWDDLPFGCAVALVELTACISMTQAFINQQSLSELDTGDWRIGRMAWKLDNIRRIVQPIPIIGKQGLFNTEIVLPERLEPILTQSL